jgi:addiction module HigA family antidote
MQKKKETPGSVLNALLKKHGLNYSSLAKAIGLSSAMVRLIALDENPVSASVASRLAAFFKMRPEYWLELQAAFALARIAQDKKFVSDLKSISTVDKVAKNAEKPGRKAKDKGTAKKGKAVKDAKKPAGKRGSTSGAKKEKPVKAAKAAGKRGRPAAKKTGTQGRPVATAKPAVKAKPAAKAKPAVEEKPVVRAKVVRVKKAPVVTEIQPVAPPPPPPPPQPVSQPDGTVNEPNI